MSVGAYKSVELTTMLLFYSALSGFSHQFQSSTVPCCWTASALALFIFFFSFCPGPCSLEVILDRFHSRAGGRNGSKKRIGSRPWPRGGEACFRSHGLASYSPKGDNVSLWERGEPMWLSEVFVYQEVSQRLLMLLLFPRIRLGL